MARRFPLAPILIVVAVVVSLPLFTYQWHKVLHILGAVLFLGNLVVTAGWMTWAVQRKSPGVVAFAAAGVNTADQWFTSPGAILLLLNGFALTALAWGGWLGFTTTGWILAGLILFLATGIVFGTTVRRYQKEMVRLSAAAVQSNSALPDDFFAVYRKWAIWGTIATILPLLALYFMVAKPTF